MDFNTTIHEINSYVFKRINFSKLNNITTLSFPLVKCQTYPEICRKIAENKIKMIIDEREHDAKIEKNPFLSNVFIDESVINVLQNQTERTMGNYHIPQISEAISKCNRNCIESNHHISLLAINGDYLCKCVLTTWKQQVSIFFTNLMKYDVDSRVMDIFSTFLQLISEWVYKIGSLNLLF